MQFTKRFIVAASFLMLIVSTSSAALGAESLLRRGLDMFRKNTNEDTTETVVAALSNSELIEGLKEALTVSAGKVVGQLGAEDGFNADPGIHIPLPEQMDRVKSALARVGMAGTFDDLELRLNRAAENATPVAKELFVKSIKDMTLSDANSIYRGEQDAATTYFKSSMSPELASNMQPIVQQSLDQVGAVQVFNQVMDRYNALPFVPKVEIDLNEYVVQGAMDGIFHYMAQEEAAIRANPIARTTDILKKVFGN